MRLNSNEIQAIKSSAVEAFNNIPYKLFLFGSRTDDQKKGGDIDLLILTNSAEDKDKLVNLKTKFRVKVFTFIPEQRIDVTVATESEAKADKFLTSVHKIEL